MDRKVKRVNVTPEMAKEILKEAKEHPKCPWPKDKAHEMWERSQFEGHRAARFKCGACSLEYTVLSWREGEPEAFKEWFSYCPECGSKGESFCLWVDNEIGRICERGGA